MAIHRPLPMVIDPPLQASADVVVVGSGSAGSTAAIAAARTGASVLLLEKLPFLGGTSTAVLDTFYGFYTPGEVAQGRRRHRRRGRRDAADAGSGHRAAQHLRRRDRRHLPRRSTSRSSGRGSSTTRGARVLLHAFVQDATMRDGRIEELLVATKAGLAADRGRGGHRCLGRRRRLPSRGRRERAGGRARARPDADHHLPHGQRGHGSPTDDRPRRVPRSSWPRPPTRARTTCPAARAATTSRRSPA